jgi:hypothetical protein
MFRAVARNNSIFIEMVSKVGLKDRSDTAWNLSQYEDIHDGEYSCRVTIDICLFPWTVIAHLVGIIFVPLIFRDED